MAFCHITTKIPGHKHDGLLTEKGGRGFPHIVFLDADGSVLAEHEGPRTPEAFAKSGEDAKAYITLREKAAKGDASAKTDLLVLQVKMGQTTADEAEKQAAGMALTPAQKAALEQAVADARILEIAQTARDEEGAKKAGQTYLEMHKAGKPGPSSDEAMQPYWILLMRAAEETKDVPAFEAGLNALKARFANLPQAAAFLKKQEETLKTLKGEK